MTAEEARAAYELAVSRFRTAAIQQKVTKAALLEAQASMLRADAADDAALWTLEAARADLKKADSALHALTCPGCTTPPSPPKPTVN